MMLQRPQLPDDNNQETAAASHYTVLQRQRDRLISCWRDQPKHDDGRSLNLDPFCGILANGGEGAINQELPGGLPNRGQYPFLGSASGCGDDERTTATSGGAAAAPAVGTRRKREACTLKPGNEGGDKRIRGDDVDGLVPKLESPPISTITTAAGDTCEGKSKASAPPGKSDYIHVRARRGQATDSHSLAERVRREKISKRMKILQDLVPGCSKIAGKAGMLDEILNYVQSLQRQVEFLSMKLAAVSPTIDFGNIDALFGKQMVPVSGGETLPHMGTMPPEAVDASSLLRLIPMHQTAAAAKPVTSGEMELPVTSAVPLSESWPPFLEVNPPVSPWEADLQTLYGVEFQLNKEGLSPPLSSPSATTVLQPPVPGKFGSNC